MVSKFALLFSLVLTSAALATPSSQLEARLARRRANHLSKLINRVEAPTGSASSTGYSSNWSGAVLNESEGTFTNVTGTFTVPVLTGSDGSASAWVGIDGDSCKNAILQTGVDFTINNGQVSFDAWYEWYPDYSYDFDEITIISGNQIRTTVTASSITSGKAIIENLTTGKTVTQELSSSSSLCGQDAEWIVEDFQEGSSLVAFVDFGKIEFTGATASGSSGSSYTPVSATTIDIRQNNEVLTSVTTSGDTVTVTYV